MEDEASPAIDVYRQRMDFNLGFLLVLLVPVLLAPFTWLLLAVWYFTTETEKRSAARALWTVPARRDQLVFGAVVGVAFSILCMIVAIVFWWGSTR